MTFDDDSSAEVVETLFGRRDVMEQLVERSMDKSELIDATGTSRSTVTRALKDLQTADLVEQTNGEYVPTPYGEFIYSQFLRFADVVELGREIQSLLPHLPLEDLTFDLAHLADAETTFSSRVEPAAPLERVGELKQGANRSRTLASGKNPVGLEAHYEAVVNQGQRFEAVCPPALFDATAADSDQRAMMLELLEYDEAQFYIAEDTIPVPLGIVDETVFFGVENEQGSPLALIETTDPNVRRWAEVEFATFREQATELTRRDFDQNWPHQD